MQQELWQMMQRTRWVGALEVALCMLGVASTAYLLIDSPPLSPTIWVLGLALFGLAERIEIDMRMAIVTPGPMLALAAAFVYGPGYAAVWASLGALSADLPNRKKRRSMAIVSNATLPGLYTLVATWFFGLLGGRVASPLPMGDHILPTLGFMVTYLVLSVTIVVGKYWLRNPGTSRAFVWEALRWEGFTWLFAIPMVYATWMLFTHLGPIGLVFVLLPVALLAWSFRLLWQLRRENRINRFFAESGSLFDAPQLARAAAQLAVEVLDASAAAVALPDTSGQWHAIDAQGVRWPLDAAALRMWEVNAPSQRVAGLSEVMDDLPVQVLSAHAPGNGREPLTYLLLGTRPALHPTEVGQRLVMHLSLAMERINTYRVTEAAAQHDGLTELLNHQAFLEAVAELVARRGCQQQPVSLLLMDADHFKRINDAYGHPAGDAVICRLAAILRTHCLPGGVVARMGGEEFGLCLPVPLEVARETAERIRAEVAETVVEAGGLTIRNLSVSIGLAAYPEHAVTVSDLLARADQALYWGAKEVGRNRVATVSSDLDANRLWDQQRGMYTAAFFHQKVAALATDAAGVGAGVGMLVLTSKAEPGQDTFAVLADVVQELRKIDDVPVRYNDDTVILLCPRTGLPHMRQLAERATRALNGSAPGRDTWVGADLVAPGAGESADSLAERIRQSAARLVDRQDTHLESNLFAADNRSAGEVLTRLMADYDAALRVLSQPGAPLSDVIEQMTTVLAFKDVETQEHSRRVVAYSQVIGREMGLPEYELEALEVGAWLHDAGKVGVPDSILKKPGPLTPAEWDMMKQHVTIGARMLAHCALPGAALDVVGHHHERWDGDGYPTGLKGEEIPLLARIFAVADVFDAMTNDRPYRKALSRSEARSQIAQSAGSHLCPLCVAAFLRLSDEELEATALSRYA